MAAEHKEPVYLSEDEIALLKNIADRYYHSEMASVKERQQIEKLPAYSLRPDSFDY